MPSDGFDRGVSQTTGTDWNGSGRTASPRPIIDAIQSVRAGTDAKENFLPVHDLPSFGEEREDCGDELEHACRDCGASVEFGRTCYQSRCPRCGSSWVLRRSANVSDPDKSGIVPRLEALRKIRNANPATPAGVNMKFHHLMFSPPRDWRVDAEDTLKRTVQVVKDMMDELGIQGWIFYHPFRGPEEGDGDDMGVWKERLFNGREWAGDVREELSFRPHFHVVGVADYVRGDGLVGPVNEETGWVIKRIADRDTGVSVYDLEAAAAAVTYCLSHTGVALDVGDDDRDMAKIWTHADDAPNDGDVHEDVERQADQAVREAAPRTLGIRPPRLQCGATVEHVPSDGPAAVDVVAEATACDGEHGAGDDADDMAGAGEGGEVETCNGALLSMWDVHDLVRKGHLLGSEEWRNTADNADELRERYENWKRDEGLD